MLEFLDVFKGNGIGVEALFGLFFCTFRATRATAVAEGAMKELRRTTTVLAWSLSRIGSHVGYSLHSR